MPSRVSFLLAMRYYAGNWAYNIWLFRKDASASSRSSRRTPSTTREQLAKLLPDPQAVDVALAMSLAHRFMHLEGRPLLEALPQAVDDIDDYEWIDGEMFGGMVLGWNFGDGHLNGSQLLDAVQQQCGFAEGELRVRDGRVAAAVRRDDAVEDRRRGERRDRGGRDRDRADARGAALADGPYAEAFAARGARPQR